MVEVPDDAYYGAQTQRAIQNFPVSDLKPPLSFIHSLALIKHCAALANGQLGVLNNEQSKAVAKASLEVMEGKHDDQFVVDLFQTGSGTSTNMNMNEVIATRANEILTGKKNTGSPIHPNDHVNSGQSSNDVIPSAIHLSALTLIKRKLVPSLIKLEESLNQKAEAFKDIRKIGRTHLQDAVPMTLGQEFSGYGRQIALGIERLESATPRLLELALGGTAVGTGINAHPQFAETTISLIAVTSTYKFKEAENHFAAQAAQDTVVETSGVLKTLAVSLTKIANDIRWLSSGPRCGLGEISIPSLQPGSSIMPGKVNPVIPESVLQVAAQVIGNDTTITIGGQSGNFELNVMLPIIAYNLIQSIELLSSVSDLFAEQCIKGITANQEKAESYIEQSLALATSLIPLVGYDKAAEIAKKAYTQGKTIREIAKEEKIISEKEQDEL